MKYLALLALLPTLILSNPYPRLPPDDPAPAAVKQTWPACQYTLSCSFAAIQGTSLATRLAYVQKMQRDWFGPRFNCGTQWRAIEGVIKFFQGKGLGAPGTWVSYTDAGIIEGIQRGGAIALGWSSNTGGNPGSKLWAKFMLDKKAGRLNNRDVHDKAWSTAEQASTDYGKKLADLHTPGPNKQTKRWFQFTNIFRAMMRNRATIINLLKGLSVPGLPFGFILRLFATRIFNWFTDITQTIPTVCGSNSAWTLSALDIPFFTPAQAVRNTALLIKILPSFVWCYIKNIF